MEITNHTGLPEAFVDAVRNDPYDPEGSDFTVTQLIDPPRVVHLKKRHEAEIAEDAADRVWSLGGQAMHEVLRRAEQDNALQEERLFAEILAHKISGQLDLYEAKGGGILTDWKETSAWTLVYRERLQKWEEQLNLLAALIRRYGFTVSSVKIVARLRDWSKTKARQDPEYPQKGVVTIPRDCWPIDKAEAYLNERAALMIETNTLPDDDLPECSFSERWEKTTKYAVMKKGGKRAVRVFAASKVAEDLAEEKGAGHFIEIRPGARVRCEDYCPASEFCNQWAYHQQSEENHQ